ncbi:carbohydrate ABC transporter permease [Cutibacterium sp. WCA-380-WT-3A]|uniref:Carbohydrate ABC transporter permease n=1 Tax=Cutibacterium porci TaxID=2605781 RepID=A0A7K0J4T5_9ACTN|nr:carbohydrate ABC transporter permease [Cutibacterium porci]MSS44944.1 carbohydrate ABC transporter permease [Cutibacterium porci]
MSTSTQPAVGAYATKSRKRSLYKDRTRHRASAIAILVALVWLIPVYWMVKSAFEDDKSLLSKPPKFIVTNGTLKNFQRILTDDSFWSAMRMSLTVSFITVVFATLFALMFSFSLSRYRFRARATMIVLVLVVQMIPAEALFISQYRMLDSIGLLNSAIGLGILYVGGHVPFMTWIMRGYVDAVPVDLEEAAQVDGCSRLGAFFRVTLPLLLPGIVATAVFGFLFAWNEYTLALIVLSKNSAHTLPMWLQTFQSGNLGYTDWGGVMAGATLMAVPVVVLFSLIQNRLGKTMTAGAVKG